MYSWGDKLTGPSTYNPKDFFRTGANYTTAFGISGGSENNTFTYRVPDRMLMGLFPIISLVAIILQPAIQHLYSTIK